MTPKKPGTSGKMTRKKKKAAPSKSPAAKGIATPKCVLPNDRVIVALMLGGVIFGFLLYLFFINIMPLLASPAITVEDVQFLRDEGEIRFIILNNEDTSNACQAVVVLFSDGRQAFHKAIDAGVLKAGSSRLISFEADIPEGKFDYDIEVNCNPVAEE